MSKTGLNTRFRSLYRQSLPGSRVNEDGCGLHGSYAWIVDGATGVTARRATSGPSDAAWLVGKIDERLTHLTGNGAGRETVFPSLEADLAGAFDEQAGSLPEDDDSLLPSACLGFVCLRPSEDGPQYRIDGAFLGDVVALVPTAAGVIRWTDERAKPFERMTLATLDAGGHEQGVMSDATRRQILENRAKLNNPGGYWVVHPRRPWAASALRFEIGLDTGEPLVLATDGFMRLVDVFDAYTDASLHAALADGRGDELMQELRERERRDETAAAYRRVKTHDDATVLVIAPEPCT